MKGSGSVYNLRWTRFAYSNI